MLTSTANPQKPDFEELSPDLQWAICQRRERGQRAIQLGAIALVGLLAAPMLIPGLNKQMDISLHEGRDIKVGPITVYKVPPALEAVGIMPPEALQTIDEGDTIGGYTVNSGYGDRVHPIHGDVRFHNGVDLPTETGVPIFAPGARSSRVKVDCLNQPGAAGLYAEISSPDIPGLLFQAMHLSECATGLHAGGSVIAKTGGDPDLEPRKAGGSTGPHLHWSQLASATMEHQKPQKGYLQWAITGQSPKTLKEIDTQAVPLKSFGKNLDVSFDINNADPSDEITAIYHAAINLGVTDPHQIAYILATAQHESASFSTLHEIGQGPGCGAGYDYDGWTGVGLVQLTWQGNFQRAQQRLGFADMSPEQFCKEVATRPDVAATILIRGMNEGWFTGLALSEFVTEQSVDYIGARRTVNGTDRASHIAEIAQNYEVQVRQWLKEYGL